MNQELGYKALLVLAPNPTVHQAAEKLGLRLDDAYTLQDLYIRFWQVVLKVKPDPEKRKHAEWIAANTTLIDVGYKAVTLIIPKAWDCHARRLILIPDRYEAFCVFWEELGRVIWRGMGKDERERWREYHREQRIGLFRSSYPLENGRLRDRYLYRRGFKKLTRREYEA